MAKAKKKVSKVVQDWLDEISDAEKREKDYRKKGKEINEMYAGEMPEEIPFNILFSNTETLLPAIYSQPPRPVVEQKHKNVKDIAGQAAANASQKLLEYLIDTNLEGYETFDSAVNTAVLDALLPGRGVTAIKYDSDEDVTWELVCPESKKWDRVYFGYAVKWEDTPWMVYELFLDEEESTRMFGAKLAGMLLYSEGEESDSKDSDDDDHMGSRKTACVYQIWDKADKMIKYVSSAYTDGFLKEEKDPLELSGFFNCPKPMQFIKKPGSLMPVSLYELYENQAKELNKLTRRLNKIIEAIKVAGLYDGAFSDDLKQIFEQEDNVLVPTDKGASLMDGSIDKSIWLIPVEKLANVATALYSAREACKSVIYEITGISDVIRGSSKASETLGAQKIKEGWGAMRLKRSQRMVQEYARSMLRLMLDISIKKLSQDSWIKMTGLDYPTNEQKQAAQQMIQQFQKEMQKQQQIAQSKAQQNGQPPQPPQPPPPQIQQQIQQAQAVMQKPSWEDILGILKNDHQRTFRIDIETNSTLDVEASEDKQLISEFMNAMAQLMNGVAPMVQQKIMPFGALKAMLMEIAQRFRFGRNVEEQLNAMKEPPAPEVPPELQKQIQEKQKQLEQQGQQIQQAQQQIQAKERELQAQEKKHQEMEAAISQEKIKNDTALAENVKKMADKIQADQTKVQEMQRNLDAQVNDFVHQKEIFNKDVEMSKKELQMLSKMGKMDHDMQMMKMEKATTEATQTEEANEQSEAEEKTDYGPIIQEMLAKLAAPKIIIRDENGKAIGFKIGEP